MMAVARYAYKSNIECEVSLENKMACGVGACLGCVVKTKKWIIIHMCIMQESAPTVPYLMLRR